MKKLILAMAAAAVAVLFIVELGAEQMFRTRFPETVETAASAYPQELHSEAPAAVPEVPEVYALFGVDAEEGESGRSDCIILVSLEGDVLRMCSLARDTMVSLPDQIGTRLCLRRCGLCPGDHPGELRTGCDQIRLGELLPASPDR